MATVDQINPIGSADGTSFSVRMTGGSTSANFYLDGGLVGACTASGIGGGLWRIKYGPTVTAPGEHTWHMVASDWQIDPQSIFVATVGNESPADGSVGITTAGVVLDSGEVNVGVLDYLQIRLYKGIVRPENLIAESGQLSVSYWSPPVTLVSLTLYSWLITPVYNATGGSRTITFTTAAGPKAINPTPEDGEQNQSPEPGFTLSWEPGDPDNPPDSYDVYLQGELIAAGITNPFYVLSFEDLNLINSIFDNDWRVDSIYGAETVEGDDWSFGIVLHIVLFKAQFPTPADSAENVPMSTELLEWENFTPFQSFGGDLYYVVYFNGVSLGRTSTKNRAMPRQSMAYNTTYTWRVDTCNSIGSVAGDTWTFTTAALASPPVGGADGTRTKRLVAAADDKVWIEEL